jgi:DNA-binding HxlR family transcriptional regulator
MALSVAGDLPPILEPAMPSHKNAPQGACLRSARRNPLADCPLTAAFAAVGGKWKLTIVYWLARQEHHFSGLLRRVAPISHKVLTEQLRELEADGIVERAPQGPVPAAVRYSLTAYGCTVLPLVEAARTWGLGHLQRGQPENPGSVFAPSCSATIGTSGQAPASAAR